MTSIRALHRTDSRHALQARLKTLAVRAEALVRAGTDLADLLSRRDPTVSGPLAD